MKWFVKNIGLCALALGIFSAGTPVADYQMQILHTLQRIEAQAKPVTQTVALPNIIASTLDFHLHPLKLKKVRS